MASLTVENYIKTIRILCSRQGGGPAATGHLAAALGVAPGSVTSMLKTLSESGLVTYTPYEGAALTAAGDALALRVIRRHRLIELFLARTLDMTWDEVHDEAENMEHAVSDLLIDRIDAFLAYPQVDPHGDPIPTADGSVTRPENRRLVDCPDGFGFRLGRVINQSSEFLRYLTEAGLLLGSTGHVVANHPAMGIVTVEVGGRQTTLGREAAEKILVHSLSEQDVPAKDERGK
ncbi:MAG: metal-dependent transcriptional regulator [Pirellulales bacterium]